MKPVRFVGSSLDDLKAFPAEARRNAGFEADCRRETMTPEPIVESSGNVFAAQRDASCQL
jgi:phage-related protein